MGQITLPPPAGNAARSTNVPLQVAWLAPLQAHAGTGATGQAAGVVNVRGAFQFRAKNVDESEVNGQSVRLNGAGRFNGRTGYRFNVDATPGSDQPGSKIACACALPIRAR